MALRRRRAKDTVIDMKRTPAETKAQLPLDGIGDESSDVRHLFSYNLQRLASVSSRIATRYMLDDFQLTVQEWRALAVLDFLGDAPLYILAQRAGIQKSQTSRLIADLSKRGYIQRKRHPSDKRSTLLSLTETGADLVQQILTQSRIRNRKMLDGLSDEERVQLMALLGKAINSSFRYLEELKQDDTDTYEETTEPASFFEEL
ncbi:MarR family winged helix-turn-helix transcriptional regulator [Roseovarius indicus]|nr:MarR family transcriptional regulator [Roseovarius indicus]